jgi:hypothetical protein
MDLDAILYGVDGIEYHLYCILFNSVASTSPKWRTFKLLRWVRHRLASDDVGSYSKVIPFRPLYTLPQFGPYLLKHPIYQLNRVDKFA